MRGWLSKLQFGFGSSSLRRYHLPRVPRTRSLSSAPVLHLNPANMLQQCIIKAPNGALGMNLSRAPWDPYPWVSGVQDDSSAQMGGIRIGDTLLQLNGADVLGMKFSELAVRLHEHWLTGAEYATMMMWRQKPTSPSPPGDAQEASHARHHGINQQSLQKFASCLQSIAQLLECPVCCDVIKPPSWQCCNGHVLCNNCRNRSEKCPVCRVPLGPRGRCLLSDKLFTLLAENFPCDGVKSDKNTSVAAERKHIHKSINKCTNEYHNQPKMALPKSNLGKKSRKADRQTQADTAIALVNDAPESKQSVKTVAGTGMPEGNEQSEQLRNNVNDAELQRSVLPEKEEDNLKELLRDSNNMLVKPKLKLSKKSWQITGRDQDELRSNEVANINNGQQEQGSMGRGAQVLERRPSGGQQKYQNYHCSTGKSCTNQTKLSQPDSANKLSTAKQESTADSEKRLNTPAEIAFAVAANGVVNLSTETHKGQPEARALPKLLNRRTSIKTPLDTDWPLQQLTAAHSPSSVHFYGTFGQRLHVHIPVGYHDKQICLCLSEPGTPPLDGQSRALEVHTFFLAVQSISPGENDNYGIFVWHLDSEPQKQCTFQTIIESQCRHVKWFGTAQSCTRSWPEIRAAGEFFRWTKSEENGCMDFDVIVNRKYQ